MSTYVIGDIQGCYKEFKNLLNEINFNKNKDTLWLAGDLVNRGPKSYDVIKYIIDLGPSAITVLGNHDFYLLASYYKLDPWPHNNNNIFEDILSNKDSDKIINWLRNQKIIHIDKNLNYILVHAGIYPKWDLKNTLILANQIEDLLKSSKCEEFIRTLWSNEPNKWSNDLNIKDKLIFSVNVFTRMRYLNKDLSLNFENKVNPKNNNSPELCPWYEYDNEIYKKYKIIIGHWSTLGYQEQNNFISIDTGCAWGNKLTAIKISKEKDVKKYQVKC